MGPEKYIKNFINGKLVPAANGEYHDNVSPVNGKVSSYYPDSGPEDLERAIDAASKALPEWSNLEPERRLRILMRVADILEQNASSIARAETLDCGKPFSMALNVDVTRAQSTLRFYGAAMLQLQSEANYTKGTAVNYLIRQPLGIVACVGAWDMPLVSLCQKVAPAIAAGNCVVAKTSELTPMSGFIFARACSEAGLPDGVFNLVHGKDDTLIPLLVEHPKVEAVTYTGSTSFGKKILEQPNAAFKKLSLELSSKNPNIIFADCNFDKMIVDTLRSSFSNNGQLRFSCPRIFVERSMYQVFRDELVKRTQFLKVGDPFAPVTDLGAIISEEQREKILSYIALAEVEGGKVLCGGRTIKVPGEYENGYYLRPALIEGLPIASRTNQEEIFGPVATITPFDTPDEVVELANQSSFGLGASIWTNNTSKGNRVAERLNAGVVWLNGWAVYDQRISSNASGFSGFGQSDGLEALKFFTQAKNICIQL